MSAKVEERSQSSNKCWICNIKFDVQDNKVKVHGHVTKKNIEVLLIGVVILILNRLKSSCIIFHKLTKCFYLCTLKYLM